MSIFPPQAPETQAQVPVQLVPSSTLEGLLDTGAFPSANLLPAAIIAKRKVRAAKRKAGLILLGTLVVLALLILMTTLQQRSADAAREQAQDEVAEATALRQKYAYVPAVYQAVTTARQELASAMGQEVQVSRLLGGLSALQPVGLSLATLDASVGPGDEETMKTNQTVIPGVGTVAFSGEAEDMDDIAAWIERLRLSADYDAPVLTDVTNSTEGYFTFTASADLTEQSLSGRYVEPTQ